MKRTKLKDRILPTYSKGEKIFNMVSHIVGNAVGIVATVTCVVYAALKHNTYGVVACSVFGATMIILYCMSSIYHGLHPNLTAKKVFQIIDHCTIFLLIAGTYTPITLCTLRNYNLALGWTLFGIIWAVAALGITLNAVDLKKYSVFSFVCYIIMGWCIVFAFKPIVKTMQPLGIRLLVLGGISYTIGAVLYAFGKKVKYFHSVFHIFCVIGSLLHYFCILFFVI